MADGDNTAGGMGMGLIIGLLLVLILVIGGGFYFMGGGRSASGPSAAISIPGGTTVAGTVTVPK